ncbi:MAG: alpha/beta fold hydrolase, partial [Myxococcota bacterium]
MSTHVVTLGAGPPVVAIHGLLLGSVAQWYFTLGPALAARHRVVMYDLPGHGLSSTRPGGYGLATLAADLERLLAELDGPADVVDLVGHSWGALVALTFAQAHPARVRRLVVIDPPLPPGDVAAEPDLDDAALRAVRTPTLIVVGETSACR